MLLDGQDTALVRCSIVDAAGHLVRDAADVVTFGVASGPGAVVGVHSGQVRSPRAGKGPTSHQRPLLGWVAVTRR